MEEIIELLMEVDDEDYVEQIAKDKNTY